MYDKQIEQLVVLQSVDNQIIDIEKEIEKTPLELADLETRYNSLKERHEQASEKLGMLEAQQQRIEGEIEEDSLKVKKSKNKLMLVGNTKEYHAMMREMDGLEKLNRLREEEKVAVVEEVARQKALQEDLSEKMVAIEAELTEKKSGLDEKLQELKDKLAVLQKKRNAAGKDVSPPILGRYEFIRSRLEHPVIVSVSDQVCSGCQIMIPPQNYNDLQKGQQIMSCPNCQRLIYWIEHIESPAAEAEAK